MDPKQQENDPISTQPRQHCSDNFVNAPEWPSQKPIFSISEETLKRMSMTVPDRALRGSVEKNGRKSPDPGVQSLSRYTQKDWSL